MLSYRFLFYINKSIDWVFQRRVIYITNLLNPVSNKTDPCDNIVEHCLNVFNGCVQSIVVLFKLKTKFHNFGSSFFCLSRSRSRTAGENLIFSLMISQTKLLSEISVNFGLDCI